MKNYFDISRFGLLLQLELFRSKKGILMCLIIIAGVHFAGMLVEVFYNSLTVYQDHPGSYAFFLLIGGFILTSLAFKDLTSNLRRFHYLTLPTSTLEKFLSMWLLNSIGWILLFTLFYTVYALIANAIGHLFFRHITFVNFDPFGGIPLQAIHYYIVLHGIFLAGAAHFKGYAFAKTLIALIVFAAVCGVIIYVVMVDLFLSDHECSADGCEIIDKMCGHYIWMVGAWMFWWLLAPLCWIVTYLGLKEQEV